MASLAAKTSFSRSITSTFPANTRLDTSPTAIFPSSLPPAQYQAPQRPGAPFCMHLVLTALTALMLAGLHRSLSAARSIVISF